MVVLVFGNVVLRYGFNSGISVSEEMSRWLFVWLTFLGGVVALHEHAHLGTEMLVGHLGPTRQEGRAWSIGYVLMLLVCWLRVPRRARADQDQLGRLGAVERRCRWPGSTRSAWSSASPPRSILLNDLVKLLTGRATEADLVIIKETEDHA